MLGRCALLAAAMGCAHRNPVPGYLIVDHAARFSVEGAVDAWEGEPSAPLLPLGVWVRLGDVVAFTYVDTWYGASAQWRPADGPIEIRRLQHEPAGLEVLRTADRLHLGLPEQPDWLANYGPQPPAHTRWGAWRTDPRFEGRLHPEFPDDLRVMIGQLEGESYRYEVVWVGVRSCDEHVCTAALLNQPNWLPYTERDLLVFDVASLAVPGLPVARRPGEPVDAGLLEIARAPEFARQIQDAVDLIVDDETPAAERLVPMSQWVMVGEQLGFVALSDISPLVYLEHGTAQAIWWRTQGMRVLTDAEIAERGLPASALDDPTGQPPPGPWGAWRLDDRLGKLLDADEPDILEIHLLDPRAPLVNETQRGAPGVRAVVRSWDGSGGTARLLATNPDTPSAKAGDLVDFQLVDLPGIGARAVADLTENPSDRR